MSLQYSVYTLPLTAAGSETINERGGLLRFLRAVDSAGVVQLSALVDVKLGKAGQGTPAAIPLGVGQAVRARDFDEYELSWSAQSAVTEAKFLWSGDPDRMDVDADPAAQLVVGDLAATVTAAAVSVGTSATLLMAANGNRRAVTVQNLGGVPVYLGPSGVTAAAGLEIPPGATWRSDQVSAALYAIAGAAGQDVRVLEETN